MNPSSIMCPICTHQSKFSFSGRDLMFNHFERYDYNVCINCDLLFQHPLPTKARISDFYPDDYDVYEDNSRLKKINPLRLAVLKKRFGYTHLKTANFYNFLAILPNTLNRYKFEVPYVAQGKLLDIGCGNGSYLHGMQQLGWAVKGVEFNVHAVSVCKKAGVDVHHGDLLSAHLDTASFDVVNLSHVIEHVPDPILLFNEISRIIKPNGLLIVKTPNSNALGRALFNTNWFANEVPRHLYLFSEKNLSNLGRAVGLNPIKMMTSSTPKIILNSVDYVLNNKGKPSKKVRWKRLLARVYVLLSSYKNQGDEIHVVFRKE